MANARKEPGRLLTHDGLTLSLSEWAERTGISIATIGSRIDVLGWPVSKALTQKPNKKFRGGRHKQAMPRPCPMAKHHEPSGQAYARWSEGGKRHTRYFGQWGSDEAKKAYTRFVADWANSLAAVGSAKAVGAFTLVSELVEAYLIHCKEYHRKGDRVTGAYQATVSAVGLLSDELLDKTTDEFSADDLRTCQAAGVSRNLSRSTINAYVYKLVAMFRWGVSSTNPLTGKVRVPPTTLVVLGAVKSLGVGRYGVRESKSVQSVKWEDVEAIFPHLCDFSEDRRKMLEIMVRLHWLTGMRSGELLAMSREHITESGKVLMYKVPDLANKTAHLGKDRVVLIGPRGQSVLAPILARVASGSLWVLPTRYKNKRESVELTVVRYGGIITRACKLAGVTHWHPHQLRHARATEVARHYRDTEAGARAIGDTPDMAREFYIDPNDAIARKIAEETG